MTPLDLDAHILLGDALLLHLRDESRTLLAARHEAAAEEDRLRGVYFELRDAKADIQELIRARLTWAVARQHLHNVESNYWGVQDRLACAETAAGLPEGTVRL